MPGCRFAYLLECLVINITPVYNHSLFLHISFFESTLIMEKIISQNMAVHIRYTFNAQACWTKQYH